MSEPALRADGYDTAIVGIVTMPCSSQYRLVYDRDMVIDVLVERDGMLREDAEEFFEFNIAGAYVGDGGPLFLARIPEGVDVDELLDDLQA